MITDIRQPPSFKNSKGQRDGVFRVLTFRSTLQTDLLSVEGVDVDEKERHIADYRRARIGHN